MRADGEQTRTNVGRAASRRGQPASSMSVEVERMEEVDDMWGHMSVMRENIVAGVFWSIRKYGGRGRIGTPATRPNTVSGVHDGVFPTAGEF